MKGLHRINKYIYIQAVTYPGIARYKLDMSYSFEEFIVILKSFKFKVSNHNQATPVYIL